MKCCAALLLAQRRAQPSHLYLHLHLSSSRRFSLNGLIVNERAVPGFGPCGVIKSYVYVNERAVASSVSGLYCSCTVLWYVLYSRCRHLLVYSTVPLASVKLYCRCIYSTVLLDYY